MQLRVHALIKVNYVSKRGQKEVYHTRWDIDTALDEY